MKAHIDTIGILAIRAAKLIFAGIVTLIFRLTTPLLGLPNVSPLMATQFVSAKTFGPWIGGLYGFLGMILLDLICGKVGPWTIATSLTMGAVGIWGCYFLRSRSGRWDYMIASIVGTLVFDLVTGILIAPLWGTSFIEAFVGQIPFTFWHLLGNCFFALFAPWFFRMIMNNPAPELNFLSRDNSVMKTTLVLAILKNKAKSDS